MKDIAVYLLLILVSSFTLNEKANARPPIGQLCRNVCRSFSKARQDCLHPKPARRRCKLRRCSGKKWKCSPRRPIKPTRTATPSPSVSPTSSPSVSPTSSPSVSPTSSPSVSPTSSPSVSPTSSPSISPSSTTPSPSPSENNGPVTGTVIGDPHIITFDGLRYDCQAHGEFILVQQDRSRSPVVHGRFSETSRPFSLSEGLFMTESKAPRVQISIARRKTTQYREMNRCRISVYVDGTFPDLVGGSNIVGSRNNTDIKLSVGTIEVSFPSGMRGIVQISKIRSFGCFFSSMTVVLPRKFRRLSLRGLLGNANGNRLDDWMDRDGNPLTIPFRDSNPSSFLFGEATIDYCINNWGVKSSEESRFIQEDGIDFAPPGKPAIVSPNIDFENVPGNVREVCMAREACLIDGILGNVALAKAAVEAEELFEEISNEPPVNAGPSDAPTARMIVDGYENDRRHFESFYIS